MTEQGPGKTAEATVQALVATVLGGMSNAVATYGTGQPPAAALAVGLVSALGPAGALFITLWFETLRRRAPSFADGYGERRLQLRAGEPATIADEAASENGRHAMLESLRALLDAVDDEVVPSLGRLTADYACRDARPDAFFRGTARMLTDLTSSEFQTLLEVVEALGTGLRKHAHMELAARSDQPGRTRVGPDAAVAPRDTDAQINGAAAERIIRLLIRNDLATDKGSPNSEPVHLGARIDRTTVVRMGMVLGVAVMEK